MITGYKKKRLGHPSEKLSDDIPRASWRAVFFSEIVWPIVIVVIFAIAYMFVKSFPDRTSSLYSWDLCSTPSSPSLVLPWRSSFVRSDYLGSSDSLNSWYVLELGLSHSDAF
jgi:hypothetical protein